MSHSKSPKLSQLSFMRSLQSSQNSLEPKSSYSDQNLDPLQEEQPLVLSQSPIEKQNAKAYPNNHEELGYLNLLTNVLENGEERNDRTGVGTYSIFSANLEFDLQKHFPLLTTKKLHFKSIAHELLWFLRGDTNIKYLKENGVRIWDKWADAEGNLGPIYGAQWRNWKGRKGNIDQIANLMSSLKQDPFSRRHIISAWNPSELSAMALPPCHILAQFYRSKAGGLSCQFYQRSVDLFLGLPFNIASYALLTYILAKACSLTPEKLHFVGGDLHIYKNHTEQVRNQLSRRPYPFPSLKIKSTPMQIQELEKLEYTDIELLGYTYHPSLPAPIAV